MRDLQALGQRLGVDQADEEVDLFFLFGATSRGLHDRARGVEVAAHEVRVEQLGQQVGIVRQGGVEQPNVERVQPFGMPGDQREVAHKARAVQDARRVDQLFGRAVQGQRGVEIGAQRGEAGLHGGLDFGSIERGEPA